MKRILIVDDEEHIREVAATALEVLGGWEVLTADCGSQAMVERPDAILLDVMMPDIDGPTTFRRLQAEPPTSHIPVILLTAKVQADRTSFRDLGVRALIAKPFDPMELANQVSSVLGWGS